MLIYPNLNLEEGLYTLEEGYNFPSTEQFQISEREDGKGKAVYTLTGHARGELIARFTGLIIPYRTQHTLQLNPNLHVLDLHFIGYLAHACAPNVFVDLQEFEVWALEDIAPESALTMDYASTEDELFKQFKCLCGSPSCRHWITGRKERVNGEGMFYLQGLQDKGDVA